MGLGKSGGILGVIDDFADELIADLQRFYGLDLARALGEAVRDRRWERLTALIVHLPPESAMKRYLGHSTLTEVLLDAQVQIAQAARRSASKQAAKKLKPITILAKWQKRNDVKAVGATADRFERMFSALGAEPADDPEPDDDVEVI